jgi:ketosteroid isomerase-like protein
VKAGSANLAAQYIDLVNRGEHAKACSLFADDMIWHGPESIPGGGPKTKAEFLEFLSQVMTLFVAQPQYEILTTTSDPERICIEVRGRGELKNGNHYDNKYCFVFGIREGKISSVREYLDTHYAVGVVFV